MHYFLYFLKEIAVQKRKSIHSLIINIIKSCHIYLKYPSWSYIVLLMQMKIVNILLIGYNVIL